MRTRPCRILCFGVSVMITAASPLLAQEGTTQPEDVATVRQVERARADLYAAQSAEQQPTNNRNGTYPVESAGEPQLFGYVQLPSGILNDPQRLPTANLQSGTYFSNAYSGFDPELARVNNAANQKVVELVKKIKEADNEQAKLALKTEMKQVLDEQYDVYLDHHEAPLKQLEERLAKLRAEFESRKKAKDDLVKLRLDTIWYEAIGLGWPDNRRSAGGFPAWRQPNQPASPFAAPSQLAVPPALSPRSAVPNAAR